MSQLAEMSGGGAGAGTGAAGAVAGLHSVEKALSIPVVEAAVSQATHLYSAVKGAHPLVSWAFVTAERTAVRAAETATPLMAPFAAPLAGPLAAADARLAAGLQALEDKVPLVKQPPEVVYAAAREAIARALQPRISQVCEVRNSATRAASSLRELSWRAANNVLVTHTGKMAVDGVDGGAAIAQRLLDYYLPPPPVAEKEDNAQSDIVSASDDPALHTVQTVSRLSVSAAERVYAATARRVRELRDSHDPARYVAALLSVLHLTRLLRPDLVTSATEQSATEQNGTGTNKPTDTTVAKQ